MNPEQSNNGYVYAWQGKTKRWYFQSVDGVKLIPTDDESKAMRFATREEAEAFYPKISGLLVANLELVPAPQVIANAAVRKDAEERTAVRNRVYEVLRAIPADAPGYEMYTEYMGGEVIFSGLLRKPEDFAMLGIDGWKRVKSYTGATRYDYVRRTDNGVTIRIRDIEEIASMPDSSVSPVVFEPKAQLQAVS